MSGKVIFGFIVFFLGLGLLLDRVGVNTFSYFISTFWPIILILIGISNLFSKAKSKITGIIFLILGCSFLLVTTNTINGNILGFIWPIILIIIGLWLMLPFNKKSFRENIYDKNQLTINTFFTYQMLKIESKELIGGQISSVFSGLELDLRNAQMVPDGATIELNNVFSGVEIIVPKNWRVNIIGKAIFGAFQNNAEAKEGENNPQLTIKGVVIFSGVEIKTKS